MHWIDSEDLLNHAVSMMSKGCFLALDTEFIRTDTFYPKLALIQISDGNQFWLIDVPAINDLSNLKQLLESQNVTTIFHACAEDLEVLEYALDIVPRNIFDTQIAAGIVNRGFSMGYARLVEQVFHLELDKHATRSDWLARPLTEQQIAYAREDVAYLHDLHDLLSRELSEQEREEWFVEECEAALKSASNRKESDDYYRRVKGAWRLSKSSLTVLKYLCQWREEKARLKDRPRGHVVKDAALLEISKLLPLSVRKLSEIDDLHSGQVRRYGAEIIDLIESTEADSSIVSLPKPLNSAQNDLLKAMRSGLNLVAEAESIPKEFLANKKELESIIRMFSENSLKLPYRLNNGWRARLVKPTLERVLNSGDKV